MPNFLKNKTKSITKPYPTKVIPHTTGAENTSVESSSSSQYTISEEINLISDSLDPINLNLIDSKTLNNKMATANEYFNALRIPDAIKELSNFNGNPRLLFDFISNVEEILSVIPGIDGTPQGKLWLRAIRNKITGQANEILDMYGTAIDWHDIKSNLISHYSDKRNETSLIRDLHNIKQNNSTIEQYYSNIVEIFSAMTNHIKLYERESNVVLAKTKLYAEMCLNVFLTGLKEPLGSVIRARNPSTLKEAFEFCIIEQNIHYARSTPSQSKPTLRTQPLPPPQFKIDFSNRNPFFNKLNNHQSPQPRPFINQQPLQQRPYQQHTPQYSPQQRPYQQHIPQQRVQQQQYKPVPMDIGSNQLSIRTPQYRPQNTGQNFFRSQSKPTFISQELHNKEETFENLDNYVDFNSEQNDQNAIQQNDEGNYEQPYEIDDSDFQFSYQNNLDT